MQRSLGKFLTALLGLAAAFALVPLGAQAQTSQRCFPETGFCIEGRIREFWEQNGGLPVFGFPIGPQKEEQIEGKPFQVQWFERNRLELHPENGRPYDVLLGRLGADRLAQQGKDWQTAFPKSGKQDGCRYFAETDQSICGEILKAWHANGLEIDGKKGKTEAENLALFGLPLSGLVTETLSDGKQYQVQWFERARFELHPENQAPYNVLLGLLGNEVSSGASAAPAPTPTPAPAPGGDQPPASTSGALAQPESGPVGTRFLFIARGFQPGEKVGVYFTAPDRSVYGAPFQTTANGSGISDAVTFNTAVSPDFPTGTWAASFEGVSSGHKEVAYFQVTAGSDPTADATATPASGPGGTVFTLSGKGFTPGEAVGIYVTRPDQRVAGAPFQEVADADGTVSGITFTTVANSLVGRYAVTFEGVFSHHKAIAYFEVTP